jgi:hypothetical protein
MFDIQKCQKIIMDQGAMYLGESTKEKSVGYLELKPYTSLNIHNRIGGVGYLELKPYTSLNIHNRIGGIENLIQVEGECVMIVFDTEEGTTHKLSAGDELSIKPEGVWHIHSNPFEKTSLTYWHFDGDIRHVIEEIKKGAE